VATYVQKLGKYLQACAEATDAPFEHVSEVLCKKLSCRRGTARRTLSFEILQMLHKWSKNFTSEAPQKVNDSQGHPRSLALVPLDRPTARCTFAVVGMVHHRFANG